MVIVNKIIDMDDTIDGQNGATNDGCHCFSGNRTSILAAVIGKIWLVSDRHVWLPPACTSQ